MISDRFSNWMSESVTVRLFIVGFMVLLLMIPTIMVDSLISDRKYRKNKVVNEIYQKWSKSQILQGPILTIPFNSYYWSYYDTNDREGNTVTKKELKKKLEYAHFLPNSLNIDGNINPQIRYRGIYEAVVYTSNLKIEGDFSRVDMKEWKVEEKDILYEDAFISFGISDLRGVQDAIKIKVGEGDYSFNPGIKSSEISKAISSGVSVPVKLNKEDNSTKFYFDLNLNGSDSLFFLPYGKSSIVAIKSSWNNPSFDGDFLPDKREITEKGFFAKWKVVDLNRAYPQSFKGEDIVRIATGGYNKGVKTNSGYYKYNYNYSPYIESSFGVNLRVPVDYYQKSSRSIKYAILIISLTFIVFFFVEIFIKRKIHPFQYLLVGFSLVLFFALLISFSEHIGFDLAYIISTIATILSITLYSRSVFKNKKATTILFAILGLFYSFVYMLLQMQDYSLLLGTIMLFMVLSAIMYISRNIDWYNIKKANIKESEKLSD